MITIPAKKPATMCPHKGAKYTCNRRKDHTGRHAFIWYGLGGIVRDVWEGTTRASR